jgi:uncharacterized lipoprotein YmbA
MTVRGAAMPLPCRLAVGPLQIPSSIDRAELVQRAPDQSLQVLDEHAWQQPLRQQILHTIDQVLARAPGLLEVALQDVQLPVEIQRLEAHGFEHVLLDAVWFLRKGGRDLAARRFSVAEPLGEASVDELARAHGRAVQALAEDIAADLPHHL